MFCNCTLSLLFRRTEGSFSFQVSVILSRHESETTLWFHFFVSAKVIRFSGWQLIDVLIDVRSTGSV